MVLPHNRIIKIISGLREIQTVKIIRIHTRALTFNPELLRDSFVENLTRLRPIFCVFHINSHLELTEIAKNRTEKLITSGILCYSQTALLNGVNDNSEDLEKLFTELLSISS